MDIPVPVRQLFIAGEWVESDTGRRLDVICPSTEAVVGSIPSASAKDVDRAIAAATAAVKSGLWTRTTGTYRAGFLKALAAKVRENKSYLAKLETLDCGKPIDEAEWDLDDVATCFDYYADLAEKLDERQNSPIDVGHADFNVKVRKEALGVVALITPWNYPLLMATWKLAPALAAGNCCILKPSEMASLTCLELAALAQEVGLPAGALSVITGLGVEAGAALSGHPGIAKIAFTGSTATGRAVSHAATQNLRPASMELGGKSALIVFDDADIDKAVEWAMFGSFWTNGQICSATSRLMVHAAIYEDFLARLKTRAESIRIGDPMEAGCRMGPVVNKSQFERVLNYIKIGTEEGGRLVTGGGRPSHLTAGYFIAPTVLADVTPSMTVWREEIFGPVLSVCSFTTEEEAVRLANDSEFGLAGAVISADAARCQRVAESLECGIVWINCSQPCFCMAPWGGIKNSGHGRELGEWGLNNFLSVKQITTYVSSETWDWYSPPSKL
ncbi:MAG: hypothetical protein WDW38_004486 [Sanguina aurantia]